MFQFHLSTSARICSLCRESPDPHPPQSGASSPRIPDAAAAPLRWPEEIKTMTDNVKVIQVNNNLLK